MKYEARVEITHLPGIADPQGATVERSLPALGYENVSHVRVGKSIRLVVDAPDDTAACAEAWHARATHWLLTEDRPRARSALEHAI